MVPRGYDKFFNNGAGGWPCVYSSPLLLSARYFLGTYRCTSMDALSKRPVPVHAPSSRTHARQPGHHLRQGGGVRTPTGSLTRHDAIQRHQDTAGEENRGTVNVSERFGVKLPSHSRLHTSSASGARRDVRWAKKPARAPVFVLVFIKTVRRSKTHASLANLRTTSLSRATPPPPSFPSSPASAPTPLISSLFLGRGATVGVYPAPAPASRSSPPRPAVAPLPHVAPPAPDVCAPLPHRSANPQTPRGRVGDVAVCNVNGAVARESEQEDAVDEMEEHEMHEDEDEDSLLRVACAVEGAGAGGGGEGEGTLRRSRHTREEGGVGAGAGVGVGVGAETGAGKKAETIEPHYHASISGTITRAVHRGRAVSTGRVYMSLLPEHAPAEAEEGFTETEAEKGEADAWRAGGEAQTS
ncbi:hypothetical protein B0H14DRAFT_2619376 [Mycena olivaceomarginata]|nr:hypothetical protein B0H14DRAFT_2619376 [Mycena olivaceomarginata]